MSKMSQIGCGGHVGFRMALENNNTSWGLPVKDICWLHM